MEEEVNFSCRRRRHFVLRAVAEVGEGPGGRRRKRAAGEGAGWRDYACGGLHAERRPWLSVSTNDDIF